MGSNHYPAGQGCPLCHCAIWPCTPVFPGCQLLGLRSIQPHGRRKAVPLPRRIARGSFSHARKGQSFAAWKVRPAGPDRGLHRAAAYIERVRICTSHGPVPAWISGFRTALPLTANQSLTTGLSKHFSASTYSATAQSLSAPHVGFDCETLEQRNVKGVPRQGTHKRGNLLSV